MGFWKIWVSLVSWKNDEHKFIWAYLGLVLVRVLLMANVNIYLCLVFLFIFGILSMTWFCLVLDWSKPQSVQNCWSDFILMPVTVSHFLDEVYVLRSIVQWLYLELDTSVLYGQLVVSLCQNVSDLDNLPVVSCRYLCLKWSYLGGGVHFAFTWLVVPVLVGVSGTETVVVCLFWSWLSCFMTKITYCCTVVSCTWGGAIFPCYDKFWSGGTCGGVPLVHSWVVCLCDGKLDFLYFAVTRCEMMNHFYYCVILNSLTEQWWAICVCN